MLTFAVGDPLQSHRLHPGSEEPGQRQPPPGRDPGARSGRRSRREPRYALGLVVPQLCLEHPGLRSSRRCRRSCACPRACPRACSGPRSGSCRCCPRARRDTAASTSGRRPGRSSASSYHPRFLCPRLAGSCRPGRCSGSTRRPAWSSACCCPCRRAGSAPGPGPAASCRRSGRSAGGPARPGPAPACGRRPRAARPRDQDYLKDSRISRQFLK